MAVYTGTSANNNWTVPRNGGTDIYDGQGGTDKLMFDRLLRSRFTITQGTDGYIHVDSVAGASSTFRIKVVNLELLAFNYGRDVLNLTTYFDSTPPTVASFVPADEATNIAPGANIVITFSEAIARGTGTIALKNAAGTVVESFDAAASARLTISGTTLTIDPTADLLLGTGYTLELPAGSIKDVSGNSYAGTSTYNFTTITAAAANAAPTGGVTITGTATQGATLTAANTLADANGLGTIGYQWKANGIEIAGATASTIVLAEAQVGATITVTASYVDGIGNAEAMTSAATSAVANVNDAPTGAVTIAGTPTQGQTLTASNTLDDPDGRDIVNYQWQADGVNISGATADTLILAEAQVGKAIAVVASYTDGHGTLETVAGTATAAVANINDAPRGCIRVTGVPVAGETLSAQSTLTDADGLGTLSYHWQSSANGIDWADIAGATAATFAATGNLVGQQLRVVGNYVDGHGTQETANSMPAAILASLAGKTADVAVYAWKTHTVLGGVTLAQSTTTQTTAADGHASFSGVTGTSLALTADRPIPTSEASATASAVNLQDSIAILKMIVGLDLNGAGKALSPYQAYAADFDGDGRVQLNDAIGVLKHVVGVQAPSPQWLFFNETNALPGWVATNPGSAPALTADIASATATVRVGLVGVLRGDVDGSYSGPAGTATVESTDAAYFQNLMATTALDLSQFGIYG